MECSKKIFVAFLIFKLSHHALLSLETDQFRNFRALFEEPLDLARMNYNQAESVEHLSIAAKDGPGNMKFTIDQDLQSKGRQIETLQRSDQLKSYFIWSISGFLIISFLLLLFFIYLNRKLTAANRKLKELHRNRDIIMTILGHDLRGPIHSYQQLAETIAYLAATGQQDKMPLITQQIELTGMRLRGLIENLLEWGNLERGFLSDRKTINLTSEIDRLLPLYNPIGQNKNLRVENALPKEIFIDLSTQALSTILRNVIDNAFKYAENNGEIHLGWDPNLNALTISNSTKPTFSTKHKELQDFFQKTSSQLETKGRTGFGLQVTRLFSQKVGIIISVSYKGGKAIFQMRFS
jgi:signal transduction histidine kinase